VNLHVAQLKAAIRALLEERQINASVVDKVNARGEIVIAVVLNEVCPSCAGTGKRRYPSEPT
jgi:hypothetical protein